MAAGVGGGCVVLIVVSAFAAVWVGGCMIDHSNKAQRAEIYGEVWKAAPELERVHGSLSSELARLHGFREDLERRKRVFESDAAKQEADRKIAALDRQIARLEAKRLEIVSAVEKQALTNLSTKLENPMQRETVLRLESETETAVGDAEALRRAIESGVSTDPLSYGSSPSPASAPRSGEPQAARAGEGSAQNPAGAGRVSEGAGGPSTDGDAARPPRSAARLFETRVWNDRYGHRVSARLLHVADARGNAVATLGVDPADIAASDWIVHLQRIDGGIIRVPTVKFSSRDLDFLAEGE